MNPFRNMLADPDFAESIQNIPGIGQEKATMREYLPQSYYTTKGAFEVFIPCFFCGRVSSYTQKIIIEHGGTERTELYNPLCALCLRVHLSYTTYIVIFCPFRTTFSPLFFPSSKVAFASNIFNKSPIVAFKFERSTMKSRKP